MKGTTMSHCPQDFYFEQLKPLLNGQIVGFVTVEGAEGFYGLKILCKDKKERALILLSDDEGSAPGSFEIQSL
jgi:hypothetical protein